jgi:hypothetical protein
MCHANRYYGVLESGNTGQLNSVPSTTRSEVIKNVVGLLENISSAYGILQLQVNFLLIFFIKRRGGDKLWPFS